MNNEGIGRDRINMEQDRQRQNQHEQYKKRQNQHEQDRQRQNQQGMDRQRRNQLGTVLEKTEEGNRRTQNQREMG